MKLDFKIWYPMNLFFVVDNLSNWSVYSTPNVRSYYSEEYDALKPYLKQYVDFRKKNGWQSSFQNLFVSSSMDSVYNRMKKNKEWKKLIPFFKKADNLYSKKWDEQKRILKGYKLILENMWSGKIEKDINSFLDKESPDSLKVLLVYRHEGGGGRAVYKGAVEVEVGAVDAPIYVPFGVLVHEVMHQIDSSFYERTREWFMKKGVKEDKAELLEETIFDCVAPRGFLLAEHGFLPLERVKPIPKKALVRLASKPMKQREELRSQLFPFVEKYWKGRNKRRYENFLKEILREYNGGGIKF